LKQDKISAADYELAVLEKLRLDFVRVAVRVIGTENGQQHFVRGLQSDVLRQLDAAVYRLDEVRPFLIADAKRHRSRLDVTDVDGFVGLMLDIGAEFGLLVAPNGFTKAAARRAKAADVQVRIMTTQQALTYRWLPVAREIYPYDWYFREELALTVRLLQEGAEPWKIIDSLEGVAFEEWDGLIGFALAAHTQQAELLLVVIARYHWDDGWRFNAIRHLDEIGLLTPKLRDELAAKEQDPETLNLLLQQGDWAV
jgi:hypothetical protein